MTLSFTHLYGDKWAALYGKVSRFNTRRIIFPQFVAEEGREYEVRVSVTKTGEFTYKGEQFRVCRAELATSASQGEVIVHQIFGDEPKTSMGAAFREAGIGSKVNTAFADQLSALGYTRKR
jgi:hypothetical protein